MICRVFKKVPQTTTILENMVVTNFKVWSDSTFRSP